ncbi:sll0787 family AIR synthase-like protein [Leptolyngbya iicbica]|uniref:Sll0787 family AIR synthase-like protein n=2 Tax=Cyanophyceae TaxID=3028117 RepID=A0A4Q7E4I0_9CYAN|nr:sll0787 family AIR synthase-like protein [Leptolyngbya sp. LK]RZM76499.1 sll0787 family AIR synthase-like protein [Leptolyngbya sp. LK]
MLADLVAALRPALGILNKRDIQTAADHLGRYVPQAATGESIALGDDTAAIPDGDGYLLLAAEGIWPTLVREDPWFAGWCGVLVNVSDIYAMGGRPIAVVDALWTESAEQAEPLWQGMVAAAKTFNVPIVGGHTNCHSPYAALSVAILGRATRLITSFDAQPGDALVLVMNLEGRSHPKYPFWDAATMANPVDLQRHFALLPHIAEQDWCKAGKDVSMGGIIGTSLMLLETSGCGAILDIDAIPRPNAEPLAKWLLSFPSYGFLLSVSPASFSQMQPHFQAEGLVCDAIGQVTAGSQLVLRSHDESTVFWDFTQDALTGFGDRGA